MFISTHYGYCYYCFENNYALIYGLFVNKEYRKKGYSRRLLKYIINDIRESGYSDDITIEVQEGENNSYLYDYYKRMSLKVLN